MTSHRTSPATTRLAVLSALLLASAACSGSTPPTSNNHADDSAAAMLSAAAGMDVSKVTFPNPDPGMPMYARLLMQLNQVYHTSEWAVIPFYRSPDQIPADFNLLNGFDFPGPSGPGAFGVPLLVSGFYLIEPNAPLGTFPRLSVIKSDGVPVWIVSWAALEAAIADQQLTISELAALAPMKGVGSYSETLRPRIGQHLVVFDAKGVLEDGRRYDVHFTHVEAVTTASRIRIR